MAESVIPMNSWHIYGLLNQKNQKNLRNLKLFLFSKCKKMLICKVTFEDGLIKKKKGVLEGYSHYSLNMLYFNKYFY